MEIATTKSLGGFAAAAALVAAFGPVAAVPAAAAPAPAQASAAAPAGAPSEVRFTIGEAALLDWLKAATPYTFSVGNSYLKIDLTLSDPRDLRLQDSRATLRIRLKGNGLPVDQVLNPVFTLRHDAVQNRYYVVVSSLPVQVPGLGTIDLKDSFPKLEIPELVQDLWRFSDRPVALNLDIRRIDVLEHALEIGADVSFAPAVPLGTRGTR